MYTAYSCTEEHNDGCINSRDTTGNTQYIPPVLLIVFISSDPRLMFSVDTVTLVIKLCLSW